MSDWDDLPPVEADIRSALETFDWTEVTAACRVLAERIGAREEPLPAATAHDLLKRLRRKRRFGDMKVLAEALLQSAAGADAQVSRQYAQALIDEGSLAVAEALLAKLHAEPSTLPEERAEAGGLLGRVYKQMYVDARRPDQARQQDNLRQALRFYLGHYDADPATNTWHGINAVALTARARRDNVALPDDLQRDERTLAEAVLAAAENAGGVWSKPTRLEACVALGRWTDAAALAGEYAADEKTFDAFEIASTRRQLEQVWELSSASDPGGSMMDELRAAEARRVGGQVTISRRDLGAVRQANFDDEGRVTRRWWKTALERSASVARIETRGGRKVGTGFLVDPAAFFDGAAVAGPVLLTNWHVLSTGGQEAGSIAPADAVANFEGVGLTVDVGDIVGSSAALDACFVTLKGPVAGADGCPLRPPPVLFQKEKRQRVYVIGYPMGSDLSFSIHDSVWLDMDATTFHYRTPTEPGSSGSPVFDEDGWRVVALHRAGGARVPRLSGVGTYEANVGVAIEAIRQAIAVNRFG
jgi:hypothetical protein